MNHLEFAANESFVSDGERSWDRWTKRVETLLGQSLDGNQAVDGFCLGYAHDAFADGATPEDYVQEVRDGWASTHLRVVHEGKIEGSPTVMSNQPLPQVKDSAGDPRGFVVLTDSTGRMYMMQRGDTITVR